MGELAVVNRRTVHGLTLEKECSNLFNLCAAKNMRNYCDKGSQRGSTQELPELSTLVHTFRGLHIPVLHPTGGQI